MTASPFEDELLIATLSRRGLSPNKIAIALMLAKGCGVRDPGELVERVNKHVKALHNFIYSRGLGAGRRKISVGRTVKRGAT